MGKFYSRIFLGCIILLSAIVSKAQITNYSFTATSGTYTPITGTSPTLIGDGFNPLTDEGYANDIPIGFTFVYNGVNYQTAGLTTNGFISLGSTLTAATFTNALATSTNGRPILAPLWDDHDIQNVNNLQYTTTGSAGSRIFIVQWSNVLWNFNATAPVISFQLRLYEGTNVVEFIYSSLAGTPNSASASIGITALGTGSGNYLSLNNASATPTVSSTTETTSIATKPASGQIYRFSPPPNCTGTPTAGVAAATPATGCYGTTIQLSLTGNTTGVAGLAYQWQYAPIASSSWTDLPGATTATYSFAPGGSYQYRAKLTCTTSGASDFSSPIFVSISNIPTYATFPYTQSFESWVNGCSTTDRPDASWGSSPSTGNNSWRRDDQGVSSAAWSSNNGAYSPLFTTGAHSARFHSYNSASGAIGSLDLFVNLSDPAPVKFLKFDYINTTGADVLKVFLSTDGGMSFTQVGATLGIQTPWASKEYAINSTSATSVIRLQATSDFGLTDIGVDNLSLVVGCSGAPVAGTAAATPTSVCYGGTTVLSLTGTTTGAGLTFQWQSSPDGTTWTNIPGATTATYTATVLASLQYRAVVTCTSSAQSSNSTAVSVATTQQPTYAITPYFQGFESWVNGCGTTDRPSANWGSIPATSDSSWRRDDQGTSASWTSTAGAYTPAFSEGAHSARFHSFNAPAGKSGILDLYINLSTVTGTKQLKFDYINTSGNDSLVVLLSTDGGTTFTRLDSLKTRTVWTTKTIVVNSNSATGVIRFRGISDFGSTDIGIDNLFVLVPCSGTPAPGTISSGPNNFVCQGNSITLSLSGQTPATGITLQWQSSTDNVNFTDIGSATGTTYVATPAAATYYRVKVTCTNTSSVAFTPSLLISVNNPQVTSTIPVTRCGPGSVPLFATASAGATLRWFATATGGTPLATGTVFNTPIISTNTTYYVSAAQGGGSSDIGLSPTATTCGTIAASTFTDWPLRFNTTAAVTINSAYVIPQAAGAFTVALRTSLLTNDLQTATFNFTAAQVGVPQQIALGFAINTPGSYQLTNTVGGSYRIGTFTCAYPYTSTFGTFSIVGSAGSSAGTTGTTSYNTFFQLNITEGCESPRTAVVAGVSPAPAFAITTATTICNNNIKALTVTSNQANFNTYTWAPITGLFTNPGATTPYTGGSATTVYVRTTVAGTYTYVATANNTSTSCQNIDSVKVTVLPASVSIVSSVPQICTSGTATLSLSPASVYGTATILWYSSTDGGVTYTPITGALGSTYTTPTLTSTTMYKAEIKDADGNSCLQPTITVTVSSPQVLTTTPGARCGPGTVTLQATGSTGTTLSWYTAATGGTLAGTGTSFTTPSLTATTTYYVSAFQSSATGTAGRATPLPTSTGFTGDDYGLVFTATQPFTLNSVDIYSSAATAGAITVQLLDNTGAVLQTAGPFVIPVGTGTTFGGGATPTTLNLGFNITPGTGYRLRAFNHTANILRDNPIGTNFTYPLGIGTIGNITSGWAAGTVSTTSYYYFYNWKFATGCTSARTAVTATVSGNTTIVTQPANLATCAGSNITLSVEATGANLSYQWRKGGVNIAGANSSTYTINATTVADAGSYDVVITGLCGTATSNAVTVTVASSNTWLGAVSTDWNTAANWCGGVPTAISDVIIASGTPFQPTISSLGIVHNITINSGATVTLTASSFLNIYGNYTSSGTLAASTGVVAFRGTATQTIGAISAGTFLVNGAGVTLGGNMTVGTTLILTSGNITLGTNNLVLNGSATGSAASHIITDGTGGVISNNVGANAATVPVGPDATHYNPVIISNGQGRNYTVKVITGVVPAILNNNRAINRTWTVTPNTQPSSNVDLILQYADGDENSNAIPTLLMEVGVNNGTQWNVVSPATGVTPSGTAPARQVGFSTTQFGPMVVSNIGGLTTPLAVRNVDADVSRVVLMPNLVNNQTVLRVEVRRTMKITWSVIDANGRVVMMFEKQVLAGQNDQTLNLSALAGGTYQLIGNTGKGKTAVVRFVKL
jgi:hypothetical protein